MAKLNKNMNFPVPDRGKGEEDITEKQLAYLLNLIENPDVAKLKSLGKWQASELISQVKEAIEESKNDFREEENAPFTISLKTVFIVFVVLVILVGIFTD